MGFLGIPDEAFWGTPLADTTAAGDRLLDDEVRGVVLDGPSKVPLGQRQTLPLVACHVDTYRALRTTELRRTGVLCVTWPEHDLTVADLAFSRDELPQDLPPPPGPDDEVPSGIGLVLYLVEARQRLNLPWRPGRLLVTLLLPGSASNRLAVALEAPPRFVDPEVERYLAQHRRVGFPRHVSPPPRPGAPLPSYRRAPETPPAPTAPGVALAAPAVAVLGEACVVRGAARVRPRPACVVRPRPEGPEPADLPEGLSWQDPGDEQATAVVPITLVVVGADEPAPQVVVLQVPAYDPIPDPAAPPELEVTFAVDLFALARFTEPQACFVMAFTGALLSAPARVAMISPEALRGEAR